MSSTNLDMVYHSESECFYYPTKEKITMRERTTARYMTKTIKLLNS